MLARYALAAAIILIKCILACSQTTYPQSARYVPLKFDLGIGDAAEISTVEGEISAANVDLIGTEEVYFEGVSAQNIGFVKARGRQFVLDGKPYYCAGTNAYYAGLKYIMSDSEVAVMMKVSRMD